MAYKRRRRYRKYRRKGYRRTQYKISWPVLWKRNSIGDTRSRRRKFSRFLKRISS